ncbi:hypothetical protein [Nakamurella aerolata]|uniref:Uncharacterized protein n=1 Tax=Nakamurella aerolata TaxID=1656892 RepID=A0A849A9N2_9ACTN|nr:hypothetical protein [Nakamurella aerolata]NNG36303.1 hypothetical protein [Nakamurella aerolata]
MVQLTLSGDAASIRASGVVWNTFGSDARGASADIGVLQTDACKGEELRQIVSTYKEGLPPRLDKIDQAWTKVGGALKVYADTLEKLQTRMQAVAQRHAAQQTTVNNANNALSTARSNDRSNAASRQRAQDALKPGETLPADTYVSQVGSRQSALTSAQNALNNIEGEARQILEEHATAMRTLTGAINEAKGLRPDDPPNWLEKAWQGFTDWVKDNADVLKKISGVLKIISAVAGVLSFIPVLAPIMGPIALVTGGAALLIDAALVAAGEGSLTDLIIDAATMALPGVGKVLGKGLKAAIGAERVAAAGSKVGGAMNKVGNMPGVRQAVSGITRANSAFERAALRNPLIRAANVRAGRVSTNASPRFNNADDAMAYAQPRLQSAADDAWRSANARSDPNYFKNGGYGPRTRFDDFVVRKGRDPNAQVLGTWAHTTFEQTVRRTADDIVPSSSGYRLRPEVSYDAAGNEVRRNAPGTLRPDAVMEQQVLDNSWSPAGAWDLKTGKAGIEDAWRTDLADRMDVDPSRIVELRPGAGASPSPAVGSTTTSTGGPTALWATPVLPQPSTGSS